jgi:hypothetical protein
MGANRIKIVLSKTNALREITKYIEGIIQIGFFSLRFKATKITLTIKMAKEEVFMLKLSVSHTIRGP